MMKKEVEVMVINAVHQVVLPTIGDLVRKVVISNKPFFYDLCIQILLHYW